MKEPGRLREQPQSDLERALLDAGASYRGSPRTRVKALAALGLAASTTGAAASATAMASTVAGATSSGAPSLELWAQVGQVGQIGSSVASAGSVASVASVGSVGLKMSLAKVLAGISLIGAVAAGPVGVAVWQRHHAPAFDGAPGAARTPAVATTAAIAVDEPASPLQGEGQGDEGAGVPDTTAHTNASIPAGGPALAGELAALDGARMALARRDARGALAGLDAYARDYPHGRLQLEAEVLRIDAFATAGQRATARRHADAFVRRHPGSVFAQRVRGYLHH